MGETLSIRCGPEAKRKKGTAANRGALPVAGLASVCGRVPLPPETCRAPRVTSWGPRPASALPPGPLASLHCQPEPEPEPRPEEGGGEGEAVPSSPRTLRVRWMRQATNRGTETNTYAFLYAPFLSEFIRFRIQIFSGLCGEI